MGRNKSIFVLALIGILALFACGCTNQHEEETAQLIEIGNDKVPSLYAVAGAHKIKDIALADTESEIAKSILYEREDITKEELETYMASLLEDGYIVTINGDQGVKAEYFIELCKKSVDDGKIVAVLVYFSDQEMSITYSVFEGELYSNEDAPPVEDMPLAKEEQ